MAVFTCVRVEGKKGTRIVEHRASPTEPVLAL